MAVADEKLERFERAIFTEVEAQSAEILGEVDAYKAQQIEAATDEELEKSYTLIQHKMDEFRREWKKMGVSFDGIYTGFMSDGRQIEKVFDFLDTFYRKKTFLLTDPIMGDDGRRFGMCTPEFLGMMKELTARADIITPNLTELCLLTDTDFRMIELMTDEKHLLTIVEQMARNVMDRGTKAVVVTGIRFTDSSDGVQKMGNLTVTRKEKFLSAFHFVGESYSGTGDLFASVIAGGRARGDKLEKSMETAGRLIGLALEDSVRVKVPRNDGVDYEQYLWMLRKEGPDAAV